MPRAAVPVPVSSVPASNCIPARVLQRPTACPHRHRSPTARCPRASSTWTGNAGHALTGDVCAPTAPEALYARYRMAESLAPLARRPRTVAARSSASVGPSSGSGLSVAVELLLPPSRMIRRTRAPCFRPLCRGRAFYVHSWCCVFPVPPPFGLRLVCFSWSGFSLSLSLSCLYSVALVLVSPDYYPSLLSLSFVRLFGRHRWW